MSNLFGDWLTYIDDDGVTPYYFNTVTEETTWVKPTEPTIIATIPDPEPVIVEEPKVVPQSPIVEKIEKMTIKSQVVAPVEKKVESDTPVVRVKLSDTHNSIREMLARRMSQTQPGPIMSVEKQTMIDKRKSTPVQITPSTQSLDEEPVLPRSGSQFGIKPIQSLPVTPQRTPVNSRPTSIRLETEESTVGQKPVVSHIAPQSADGWVEFLDKKTGKYYYFHPKTKKTQWTKPDGFVGGANKVNPKPSPTVTTVTTTPVAKKYDTTGYVDSVTDTLCGIKIALPKVTYDGKSAIPLSGKNTLVTYAQLFFKVKTNGSGFFKKSSNEMDLYQWQKSTPKVPYHAFSSDEEKIILPFYEVFQAFCAAPTSEILNKILNHGMNNPIYRNEMFVYAVKQIGGNPTPLHAIRGLRLMTAMIATFVPSKRELSEGLLLYIQDLTQSNDSQMATMATVCKKRLESKMLSGVRKTLPSSDVLKEILQGSAPVPLFGVLLEEYVDWQEKTYPDMPHIFIVDLLIEHLHKINGFENEGLFRLTGEANVVESTMDQFTLGKFAIDSKDPHVCTSILKIWLRELAEPLVPSEFYEECLASSDDKDKCVALVARFPQLNQSVILQIIQFLAEILTEDFFKHTKMQIENISVVFAPNLLRNPNPNDQKSMMMNSATEAKFVRKLIESAQGK